MVPSTDSLNESKGQKMFSHKNKVQSTSAHLFIVSAHFTDNVLKEPNISIMPANPKWIGFQPIAAFDIF